MKAPTIGIGFVAAIALALPASALGAEESSSVVPPENSAATQYTEAVPTAGGDKPSGGSGKKQTPAKVLGSKNAEKLESQGREGREVAQVVAETAPRTSAPADPAPAPVEPSPGTSAAKHQGQSQGGDGASSAGDAGKQAHPERHAAPPVTAPPKTSTELPSGSSGFGEVLAEATGSSSSGQLGALLPLAILAAIGWSLAYFWRQRRPAD
ncbi:MAG TPA: hypothetical protein VFM94_08680 [Solirubrobacterales bacterium]|nr:hypothetical protein [Solirubrobacterales bacterium]